MEDNNLDVIVSKHLTAWPLASNMIVMTCHKNLTAAVPPYDLAQEFKAVYNAQLKELWKMNTPEMERVVNHVCTEVSKEIA